MAAGLLILYGVLVILLLLYYYLSSIHNFWKDRGIPGPQPTLIFGNLRPVTFGKMSFGETIKQMYNEYKHVPVFGIFEGNTPILVVNDLDMIKDVLIRDFSLFADRGMPMFPKVEPLVENLINLEPERWRPLRTKLSPVFTSGKMRDMFHLMVECGQHLEEYLHKIVSNDEPIECGELAAKFTTDVIGSCVFGISMNSLSDEDSKFRTMGRQVFAPSVQTFMRDNCRQLFPSLYNLVGYIFQPHYITDFFKSVVVDTMNYREKNNIIRPDFINMLMELKKNPHCLENIKLTDSLLSAQALVFFLAGFETSSTTMSHSLYELAMNNDIQDKLRNEIRENFAQHGETLTYERVKQMKYLDWVFRETLRKYPIVPVLMRKVCANYTFKGTNSTIPKGTKIWIPVYGIHLNPEIFSKPEVFDPERFTKDAVSARHPMSYLAFGEGPRNCVGARFAFYQSKVGLISILRKYRVDVCEKTTIPYESASHTQLLTLKGGFVLKITKVE
ncbi:PREDICTED: probable cytochrome P450 6a13 [Dufourea novaeangliae]|uniref:probable cytochrome P450 6a13 n=1 Tax=Dufourea novaeangliae TaxID=178035 RepID=UPI0007671EC3|nr:PREDICTED: probable cytochrome P450 6a13 [Dufourea novaeangliae]